MVLLTGQLALHRVAGADPPQRVATELTIWLYDSGSTVPRRVITTDATGQPLRTDDTGFFAVPLLPGEVSDPARRFDVRLRPAHALSVQVTGLALTPASDGRVQLPPLPVPNEGDVNGDDHVSLVDFSLFVTAFGRSQDEPGYDPRTDFNQDGRTDLYDFSLFVAAGNFGTRGPLVAAAP